MYYRIIKTRDELPDVLLYFEKDEDFKDCVVIQASGVCGDIEDSTVYEVVNFDNAQSAKLFIEDYSLKAANYFCEKHEILY